MNITVSSIRPRSWRLRCRPIVAAAAIGAASAGLGGCGATIGDAIPNKMGGLAADAPARPPEPALYPAVHEMPPPRNQTRLSEQEIKRAEDELIAARERQSPASRR